MKVYHQAHDITVFIEDRRRYGGRHGTTYTWLRFDYNGITQTPDPWPMLMPPKAEVDDYCRSVAAGKAVGITRPVQARVS